LLVKVGANIISHHLLSASVLPQS